MCHFWNSHLMVISRRRWSGSLGSPRSACWNSCSPLRHLSQEGGGHPLLEQVRLHSQPKHRWHREVGELRGLLMSLAEKEGTVEQEVFIGNLFLRVVFCFWFFVLVYFNKSFFSSARTGETWSECWRTTRGEELPWSCWTFDFRCTMSPILRQGENIGHWDCMEGAR